MLEKKPNFILAGAPKCGTTSLWAWLNQHPQIFFPHIKEPNFFYREHIDILGSYCNIDIIESFEEYLSLYNGVTSETAIGEANPGILPAYKSSIGMLKRYLGDPKIIIILRNPTDRALSGYQMWHNHGMVPYTLDEIVAREDWMKTCKFIKTGLYYEPVKFFLQNFTKVKIIFFEDLKNNPDHLLKELYRFLEVDENFVPKDFLKENQGGSPRNKLLHMFLNTPNPLLSLLRIVLPHAVRHKLIVLARKNLKKTIFSPDIKKKLSVYYREDIEKLSLLLHKDFNHWHYLQ